MNALELVLGTWEPLNLVFFFLFCCVQPYALQHCYSSSLRDKLLIFNGGLTWEGLVRCLMSFGVDGVGIF